MKELTKELMVLMASDLDMDVDVLESGGPTSLGLPPSLSKPHDLPYPTQSNRRNFTALQILIPFPTSFQRSAPGTAPWKGEYHVRATVRRCNGTTYDVQHTMYDAQKYNSTARLHVLSKQVVSK